jgi:hypothetical protein
MTGARVLAVVVAAIAAGGGVVAIVLTSDHHDAKVVWAIFGPAVGWSFIGTGLYAWRRRPESRIGALMVLMGFAWFLFTLDSSDSRLIHTVALVTGGLWGGVFLHIGMSFPSGRLEPGLDRTLVIAGYLIFPLAFAPALLFAGPHELGCDDCPENLLLIRRDEDLANVAFAFGALLYAALFVIVLRRAIRRWRLAEPLERLQLTPVYACALLTFLLVTVARAGAGDVAWWAAFVSAALLPFAFLGGLLRTHLSRGSSRSCAPLARGSWRRRTPSAGASSATCTTAPRRGWSLSRSCSAARGRARLRIPSSRACSSARRRSCRRAWPSCGSWLAASTRSS